MASTNCWRCLARPSQRLLLLPATKYSPSSPSPATCTTIAAAAAAFSTSAIPRAQAQAKSSDLGRSRHVRSGKKMTLSRKKRPVDRTKPPLPGERKAFRKRIQLSNDNAIAVAGLDPLTAENLADPDAVGRVVGLPDALVDQLRASEAFKPTQNWKLFRSPHVLIRRETVEMARQLGDALEKKETLRLVLTGDRGSGKSILGLQALAAGFLNKCVVINIPEAQDLTFASTEYVALPNSDMFSQPVYLVKLMQAMSRANQAVLSQCRVELDHFHLSVSVNRSMSLLNLLNASKEPEFAWSIFQSFWKELLLPGRPPVLFALDGLSHVMQTSRYRSPAFELVHSHDLALVRLFVDSLGGRTEFPNGALVLGVTSLGNAPVNPSLEKALEQAVAAQQGSSEIPARDPFYRKYDERVFDALRGVRVLDVKGVSKTGARALMEYWAASGVLRMRVDERNVSEKWTMAGGGVLAQLETVALYDLRAAM